MEAGIRNVSKKAANTSCIAARIATAPFDSVEDDGSEIDIYCLSDVLEIADIEKEWEDLRQLCGEPFTYFQSSSWCISWIKAHRSNNDQRTSGDPRVYVGVKNGNVVFIWPLMLLRSRAGVTLLVNLTEPLSQYSNLIHAPGEFSVPTGKEVFKRICAHSGADAVCLSHFPRQSFISRLINNSGLRENGEHQSAVLDFSSITNWESYHAELPKTQRRERNRRRNRLEKEGSLSYVVREGGSEEFRRLVHLGLSMKCEWLKNTGRRQGILGLDSTTEFLSSLPGKLDTSGGIGEGAVAHALLLDHKPVSIEIGMLDGSDYHSFLGAIDWQLRDFSPGKVQLEFAQKWAHDIGIKRFDFLNDPSAYKKYWTNDFIALDSRSVPLTAAGYMYCMFWRSSLKPLVKQFYQNTGSVNRELINRLYGAIRLGREKI